MELNVLQRVNSFWSLSPSVRQQQIQQQQQFREKLEQHRAAAARATPTPGTASPSTAPDAAAVAPSKPGGLKRVESTWWSADRPYTAPAGRGSTATIERTRSGLPPLLQSILRGFLKAGALGYALRLALRLVPAIIRIVSGNLRDGSAAHIAIARAIVQPILRSGPDAVFGLFVGLVVAILRFATQVTWLRKVARPRPQLSETPAVRPALTPPTTLPSISESSPMTEHHPHLALPARAVHPLGSESATEEVYEDAVPLWVRSAIAGVGLAGISALLHPSTRGSMSLFVFVRALEVVTRGLARAKYLPTWEHADTAVMALASSQVIYAWIFDRRTIESSYARFLDHHGARPFALREHLAGAVRSQEYPWSKVVSYWHHAAPKIAVAAARPARCVTCSIIHPGYTCTQAAIKFWQAAFFRSIKVYLPVHALPALSFRFASLWKDPVSLLSHVGLGVVRSSAFLASYCMMGWTGVCILDNLGLFKVEYATLMVGAMCGACVIIEAKSRRIELGLYVLTQALHSWFNTAVNAGLVKPIPGGTAALFGLSGAVCLHAFLVSPDLMRKSYARLLRTVCGLPSS